MTRSQVLAAAGMTPAFFTARLSTQTFTVDDIARLAAALGTTSRALATTTTVILASERLGLSPVAARQ